MSESVHLGIVILAAGQGSRMKSSLPKVLHKLAGRPLLQHVVDTSRNLSPRKLVIVYGHGGDQVRHTISGEDLGWAEQAQQLGTGHAVMQAMPVFDDNQVVMVLNGDVPLVNQNTLTELASIAAKGRLGLLTVHLDDPTGYGRIVRDQHGNVERIVEHKDASEHERGIGEVNTGILAVNAGQLRNWLSNLGNDNAQGEYYLTDIIALAVADGIEVEAIHPLCVQEVMGVNSRVQLAELERLYQCECANALMTSGVTIIDPTRIDIRGNVTIGQDVTLDVNVVLEGEVTIGSGTYIGPNCFIKDSVIGANVEMLPMCVVENARVGEGSRIGPYSRLRPGAELIGENHIGNFVEIKTAKLDRAVR